MKGGSLLTYWENGEEGVRTPPPSLWDDGQCSIRIDVAIHSIVEVTNDSGLVLRAVPWCS